MDLRLRKRQKYERGQTLVAAVIIMVILLVAVILLFDVQNMIRGKVKGQNAVDAAALAGANWQMHSLNLVGELNLVKAATVLLSDAALGIQTPPEEFTLVKPPQEIKSEEMLLDEIRRVEEEKKKFKRAIDLLTQMQTRISFTGPLIGFGAAQQAAKNNGITSNFASGELLYEHFYKNIMDDALYGNDKIAPQIINDYAWRIPYSEMILKILDHESELTYGIAACPRFEFIGAPSLTSKNGNKLVQWLAQKSFYNAVNGDDWCALLTFLDATTSMSMGGAWWGEFDCDYSTSFLEQAEILPLHIEYYAGYEPYRKADEAGVISKIFTAREKMQPLSATHDQEDPYRYTVDETTGRITLLTKFDKNGNPIVNPDDTDLRYNILPLITWAVYDSTWEKYPPELLHDWRTYLDGTFKPGLDYYSGALSYFEVGQYVKTMIGKHNVSGSFKGNIGNDHGLGKEMKDRARAAHSTGQDMKTLSTQLAATASAKPIGKISLPNGTTLSPFEAGGVVFPVFTHSVLLPVSLEPPSGFGTLDVGWFYYLTEFIPILGQSSSLSEAWEQAAKQYPDHTNYFSPYYSALKKVNDPAWRQRGLDWLNTPISYYTENGVRKVLQRKRDTCDDWVSGGSGGPHRGPGALH